jgi:hypothetical protein
MPGHLRGAIPTFPATYCVTPASDVDCRRPFRGAVLRKTAHKTVIGGFG